METRLRLLDLVHQKPGVHLREISRALKVGIPTVIHHARVLEKEKMITRTKEGRNVKLYLNYKNEMIMPYLSMVECRKLGLLPAKIKESVFEFLEQLTNKPLLSIIFGSYAKENYTRKSDVDLFLVFNRIDREDIESKAKLIRYRHGLDVAPVYVTFEEFRQRFFSKGDGFMRELKQNKIIVHGVEWWVMLESQQLPDGLG